MVHLYLRKVWDIQYINSRKPILQVKKFMVGYEMLAQSQRDLTAEQVIDPKFIHTTG